MPSIVFFFKILLTNTVLGDKKSNFLYRKYSRKYSYFFKINRVLENMI